jgi:hypothetical protein
MKLVFITRSVAVCKKIAERLPAADFESKITDNTLQFYTEVMRKKSSYDLIICDYCQFPHDVFNIYEFLNEKNNIMPVIFYNDPFPDKNNRVAYWISQNEEQFHNCHFDNLRSTFELLAGIIEDPAVHPYISLIQPPRPVSSEASPALLNAVKFDLSEFRRRNQLSPALFCLFEYLYKKRDRDVSVHVLGKILGKHSAVRKNSKAAVYTYISRLKKILENDHSSRIGIVRTGTGLYQLRMQ